MGGKIVRRLAFMFFMVLILSGCANNSVTNKSVDDVQERQQQIHEEVDSISPEETDPKDAENTPQLDTYEITMKRDLLCLMLAYPEFISGVERGSNKEVYVLMKSGKKLLYDDKREKTYDQKLADADLQDTMEMLYPLNDISELMKDNYDPGRVRSYALLNEVYGGSKQKIEQNLKGVSIGGKVCSFNKINGAADALQQAAKEISILAESNNKIYSNVFPVNGTYNYRVIAGTNQLSPHAYAIAIDFKSDKRDYWKWASREQGQKRIDEYPRDFVRALEENNFIWGGKWAHFDILHFEYRPELIIKAKNHTDNFESGEPWYNGFDSEDENVKSYIEMIDEL